MISQGLMEWVFELVRRKMEERGLMVRGGEIKIVDATIVSTARLKMKEVEGEAGI
jgi:hypothetical protein